MARIRERNMYKSYNEYQGHRLRTVVMLVLIGPIVRSPSIPPGQFETIGICDIRRKRREIPTTFLGVGSAYAKSTCLGGDVDTHPIAPEGK